MAIEERRTDRMVATVAHVFEWLESGPWQRHRLDPGIADFAFGNPQEMPLPGLVDALQRNAVPRDKDWFAYKFSEDEPRRIVAATLKKRTGHRLPARGHRPDHGRVRRPGHHDPGAVRRR